MNLPDLIETHGYWLVALGCLLEGETVLVLAGFAAHRGYLHPAAVLVIAAVAGFAGDEFFFWLGRRHGQALLARWPQLGKHADRVHRLIAHWRDAFIVGVRFAYGLRTVGPAFIGMSDIPAWRFAAFNALGAVLWASVVMGAGWVFGEAAHLLLGHLRHLELWLALGLGAAALAYGAWRYWSMRGDAASH